MGSLRVVCDRMHNSPVFCEGERMELLSIRALCLYTHLHMDIQGRRMLVCLPFPI